MKKTYDVGVIVGRFQIDRPHPAHMELILQALDKHQNIVILLGISPLINTKRNPLDFISRKLMIEQYFNTYNDRMIITQLPDQYSDKEWSKEVDKRIKEIHPTKSIVLYGGRDSFINYYTGNFDTQEVEQEVYISATDARLNASQKILKSLEYRIGLINGAYSRYNSVISTVDIVVFNNQNTKILLAKKSAEDGWRFIGGHEDPSDTSGEHAAKRELTEETGGNAEFEIVDYIGRFQIDDWRYKNEVDSVMTTFYKAKHIFGPIQPDDDIDMLQWFDIDKLDDVKFVKDHIKLQDEFKKYLKHSSNN